MKKIITCLAFGIYAFILNGQCPVPTLLSLNEGEEITGGTVFDVEFDYGFYTGWENPMAYFEFSDDGGENWQLFDSMAIDTTILETNSIFIYNWMVPEINSTNCLFRVYKFILSCWDESEMPFRISSMTSTAEISRNPAMDLLIYPNPINSQQTIYVDFNRVSNADQPIVIKDGLGRHIETYTLQEGSRSIRLNGLPAGLYYLFARIDDVLLVRQLLIR
ncbi:MAG: T9SS type A sorting domain-containing protein [Bacteroidota bacterium]